MEKTNHEQLLNQQHKEKHFASKDVVKDVIIGVSDGLTVPFALAAGLSASTKVSPSIVLVAGLAEVAAGSISMGLGGFLAAKSEGDHYMREMKREQEEIINCPDMEAAEIAEILAEYGLEPHEYAPVVNALRKRPQAWLDFMMKFELGLEKPRPGRALETAFTIAAAYIVGGLVPLLPYMFIPVATEAMITSIWVTLMALFFFGYIKGLFTGDRPMKSAFETTLVGAIACAASYGMGRIVQLIK
ncbi:hypothetical protein MKW98_019928 [Papaver atlanticum]|uniref:Vacuolar iron transporter n=1 Tax=Papaver atlanticum TaxID=357466 RepID=A0AAD4S0V8_9MAGN|nr:hypothetical protein MKW98_019928 [Papaver atlanticum]